MNLIYRRVTYSIFIILFFILTPLILLYTQGYRYSFNHKIIQKTGILIVSSSPRGADIFLNGKNDNHSDTPAKIKHLLPGDYEIKLVKDGYHPWQKQLPIFENSTTFAEKVLLWKQDQPTLIADSSLRQHKISPDGNKLAIISDDSSIATLNLNKGIITTNQYSDNSSNLDILGWSNTSKKVIIKSTKNNASKPTYSIVNLENLKNQSLILDNNYLPENPANLKWDSDNDNVIYSLNNQGVWQTEIFEKKKKLIFELENIQEFLISKNDLFYIQDLQLYHKKINQSERPTLIYKFKDNNISFIKLKDERLFVLDKTNNKLLIISINNSKPLITIPAKNIAWLNNETLLAYTEWELWIYNINKNEPELITRTSQAIQQAIWHPNGRHIIFENDSKLKIIELDNRELRNTITLIDNITSIDSLHINNSGSKLYFSGEINQAAGLFALNIR